MKILYLTLATISVVLSLIFSILPFGNLAFIPIILGLLFSLLALNLFKNEGKNSSFIKVLFLGLIISLTISIYRSLFTENRIAETEKSIEREQQSEEDALKELESIDIEN